MIPALLVLGLTRPVRPAYYFFRKLKWSAGLALMIHATSLLPPKGGTVSPSHSQLLKYYSYFIASYPNNLRYNPIWPIQYDSRSMQNVSESKSVKSPPGILRGSGPFN